MDTILVVNAGSSSVKFQVFSVEGEGTLRRQIKGQIDGIGAAELPPGNRGAAAAWQVVERERARLGSALEIVWVLPDYHEQFPKPCMGGWARAYMTVTPAGEVWPCHAAGSITTLQFENVRERSLEWIWHESPAFNRFRGDAWMKEPCRSCPEKGKDFGGCRCQAYLLTGDADNADPVCDLSPHHALVTAAVARAERAPKRVAEQVLTFRDHRTSIPVVPGKPAVREP